MNAHVPYSEDVNEPTITVNGVVLTQGQAMTVRVVLELFLLDGQDNLAELGELGQGYARSAREVRVLMSNHPLQLGSERP